MALVKPELERYVTAMARGRERPRRRVPRWGLGVALMASWMAGAAVAAVDAEDASEESSLIAPEVASSSGAYLAAIHAEFVGDMHSAADFFLSLVGTEAETPDIRRRAFLYLVAVGRFEEALPLAEEITGRGQAGALSAILRSITAARAGDWTTAEELLDKEMPGSFGEIVKPLMRAWILQGRGETEAAIAALAPLSGEQGFELFYNLHAGLIYDLAGEQAKAETHFVKAYAEDDTPALRVVHAYVSFLVRAGKTEEASAILEAIPADDSGTMLARLARASFDAGADGAPMIANAEAGLAEALFELATAMRQENLRSTALFMGWVAASLQPDFALAHILLAEILNEDGQLEAAIESYERVAEDSPLWWPAQVRRGELMGETGRIDDAVAILEELAERQAERPEPLIQLGHLFRSNENFLDAVDAYDRAAERIDEWRADHWSLFYSRGIALERSKMWERAESDFLRALEFQPEQPYVLNYLGYSWVDQGINLERAKDMIERAVELRPRDGYIVDSLGWALYRLGDFEGAVRELERAVELRPEDPVINDHLGDAYWRVGRSREARFQWDRALSLEPDADQVDTIKNKIENGLDPDQPSDRDS